jgi:hypothetical protein
MDDLIQKLVMERIRRRHDVIETACEVAISYGQHGVAVLEIPDRTVAFPCSLVPYGQIYQFPSSEAFDRWIENGCPS